MGWPLRISRKALGERKKNRYTVEDPVHDSDANEWNLLAWQVAGLNVVASCAWVVLSYAGAREFGGEAWNPDASDALRPTCNRTAQGIYTVTFEAEYADENEAAQPFGALAARASIFWNNDATPDPIYQAAAGVDDTTLTIVVRVKDLTTNTLVDLPTDAHLAVEVW